MTGRCEDCKHWDTSVQLSDSYPDTTGACRAVLPLLDERNCRGRWPITADTDDCDHCSPRIVWPRNMRDWQFDEEDPRHPNYVPF